jgi:hypothetical protein
MAPMGSGGECAFTRRGVHLTFGYTPQGAAPITMQEYHCTVHNERERALRVRASAAGTVAQAEAAEGDGVTGGFIATCGVLVTPEAITSLWTTFAGWRSISRTAAACLTAAHDAINARARRALTLVVESAAEWPSPESAVEAAPVAVAAAAPPCRRWARPAPARAALPAQASPPPGPRPGQPPDPLHRGRPQSGSTDPSLIPCSKNSA